jgi:hypothetical protein
MNLTLIKLKALVLTVYIEQAHETNVTIPEDIQGQINALTQQIEALESAGIDIDADEDMDTLVRKFLTTLDETFTEVL